MSTVSIKRLTTALLKEYTVLPRNTSSKIPVLYGNGRNFMCITENCGLLYEMPLNISKLISVKNVVTIQLVDGTITQMIYDPETELLDKSPNEFVGDCDISIDREHVVIYLENNEAILLDGCSIRKRFNVQDGIKMLGLDSWVASRGEKLYIGHGDKIRKFKLEEPVIKVDAVSSKFPGIIMIVGVRYENSIKIIYYSDSEDSQSRNVFTGGESEIDFKLTKDGIIYTINTDMYYITYDHLFNYRKTRKLIGVRVKCI